MRLLNSLLIASVTLMISERNLLWGEELAPIQLPRGGELQAIDFDRHVASLLGRLGCNSAACHGSFQGKGGLRLSLFGQSAAEDYKALLGDAQYKRINRESPELSLVLVKATGGEDHGGGERFAVDSWEYQIVHRWISAGASRPDQGPAITRLSLEPAEIPPLVAGAHSDLRVFAEFSDNTREDVTSFAEFRTRDDVIAAVDAHGILTARESGTTTVIVSYRGQVLGVPVIVPYASADVVTAPAATNLIDEEINLELARCGLSISPKTDDAEFLRRVTLDVVGILPGIEDVRRFLADEDPTKRVKKIDELLMHPRRAVYWATRMCEITSCSVEQMESPDDLKPRRAKMWHDWFRKRFAENMPYDQIAHGVLCAVSHRDQSLSEWLDGQIALEQSAKAGFDSNYEERADLDLYWRRLGQQGPLPVEDLAELTASAFLGLRLKCARCHQHPYDRWTQHDFAGFANIFARVEFGSSTELRTTVARRLDERREARKSGQTLPEFPRVLEVFVSARPRQLVDSAAAGSAAPRPPGGSDFTGSDDPRDTFFAWLVADENPYFAANFVNRTWARYFGAGLVEPVDAFSAANPASHPKLLTRMAAEFRQSGYDVRRLERLILNSDSYQRTSRAHGNNLTDQRQLSHMPLRPLIAEVMVDSLNQVLESSSNFGKDAPPGSQALELAVNRVTDPLMRTTFQVLGRPERKVFCDCERASGPSVRKSLFLLSDATLMVKIREGRLKRLIAEEVSNAGIVGEFSLATLSRPPTDEELSFYEQHIATCENRTVGLTDIVWALINSREFAMNH